MEGDSVPTSAPAEVEADPPVASSPAADQGPATTAETSVGDGNEVAKTDSADNDSHVHPVAGLHSDSNIEAQTHSSPQSPSSETDNPPSERNSTGDTEAVNTTENGIVDGGGEHGDVEKVEKPESTSQEVNADEATQGVQRTKSSSSSRDNLPEAEAASNAPTASASSADTTERSDPLNDTGSRKRVQVAGAASVTDQPASLPKPDSSRKHVGLPAGLREAEEAPAVIEVACDEAQTSEDLAPIQRGKIFDVNYMGSTQLVVDNPMSKSMRVTLAYEAVSRVKQPDDEPQPLIPVHFNISTESVKIIHRVNDVILMDHPLRSISYVADIGRLVVVMARRRFPQQEGVTGPDRKSKLLCHVLESDDAHHISETIGFAFNYAYRSFLEQNGIDEESLAVSDYADILSVQRMPQDELEPFIGKDGEDEFQLVKKRGEPLGFSVMESGWGSMIPTVTVSHLLKGGAAAKSNRINVGDQILAVAGKSLVGIPIVECIEWLKSVRHLTMVKIKLIHTPPVVDVNVVRPDLKFPLGFSVLDGTVTSLLRGSIGERGGIRVGHRIIEINSQSTVNMKSEQLLDMLSTSTGHVHLKTMPLHLYKIMTGETPPEYV